MCVPVCAKKVRLFEFWEISAKIQISRLSQSMFSFWRVIFKYETWKFEVGRKFGKSHERKIVIEFQENSVKILWKLYFNMAAIPTVSSFAWKIQGKPMLKVVSILVLFLLWFQEKMEATKVPKYSYTSQTIQDQFFGSGLAILQLNCQIYLWHWNLVVVALIYKTKWIQQLVIFGVVYEIIEAQFYPLFSVMNPTGSDEATLKSKSLAHRLSKLLGGRPVYLSYSVSPMIPVEEDLLCMPDLETKLFQHLKSNHNKEK